MASITLDWAVRTPDIDPASCRVNYSWEILAGELVDVLSAGD